MHGRHGNRHWTCKRLRNMGYRMTLPREVVIEFLSRTEEHVSAEDIYVQIHERYPNIGLTTVYRTLDLLHQMGMVTKFDFGEGRSRYELKEHHSHKDHHHHLVCKSCARVIDYTDFIDREVGWLREVEKGLSEKHNFRITGHRVDFYGLCEECQRLQNGE